MNLTPHLTFLIEYLNFQEAVGDPDASWELFQLKHLNNPSLLEILLKSRQIGFSWLAAAEAMAISCLIPRSTSIFVSINQDEAAEKIRYSKNVLEALDREVRPNLLTDNRFALELNNGSRLISHPCRPIRGKPRAYIYLDEFAHYPNDAEVYQSALPALSKGGTIRIGSSPMGARGRFWEIYTESMQKYPGYVRSSIPWWKASYFCKDPARALVEAEAMSTEARLQAFATPRLIQIMENMVLEDFQQEYECAWLDETVSWIDWDLIKRNQVLAAEEKLWYRKVRGINEAMNAVNEVAQEIIDGKIEQTLVGGMDIGRVRDTTEIILLGTNTNLNALPYRLHITLSKTEFEAQEAVVRKILDVLPITSFLIDRNGLGTQLAENMEREYPQAEGVDFTNQTKELWAVEAKLRAQRAEVPIPLDRDLMYQIHSIRRTITAAKNSRYDTQGNEKHHADMFWAWALAIWAGKTDGLNTITVGDNPLADLR